MHPIISLILRKDKEIHRKDSVGRQEETNQRKLLSNEWHSVCDGNIFTNVLYNYNVTPYTCNVLSGVFIQRLFLYTTDGLIIQLCLNASLYIK